MILWSHQHRAIDATLAAIAGGKRRLCVTSPTGMGKTLVMLQLARHYLDRGGQVAIFTNRRLLLEQFGNVLAEAGLEFGVRAHGEPDSDEALQVVSTQTVISRGVDSLPQADLVLVDECHLHCTGEMGEIQSHYLGRGSAFVGFTATPIDIGLHYRDLIVAGTVSEGRACGALVKCKHYGPDEPDTLAYRDLLAAGKNLSEEKAATAMGPRPQLFGRVFEWFNKLNPDRRPTLLFAPGVAESVWFAQQFTAMGVPAAHIDGADVWIDGTFHRTNPTIRQEVLDASRTGQVRVVCNRYVLREGVDAPWLQHGILATVFGSLQSYLQSGGRLLRSYPGVDSVTLQDHGGNWHRHGSLNVDREWDVDCTAAMLAGMRLDRIRAKEAPEPARCPECAMIVGKVMPGDKCMACGYVFGAGKRVRPVVMTDGSLRLVTGDIYKPRTAVFKPDTIEKWVRCFWRARNSSRNMTMRQAIALFVTENHYWPPETLPYMPKADQQKWWYYPVKQVPYSGLRPGPSSKRRERQRERERKRPGLF